MKALVGAFNQEKALVGAFSVIVQRVVEPMDRFTALARFHGDDPTKWGPGDGGWSFHIVSTVSEWLMALSLDLAILSLVPEFRQLEFEDPRIIVNIERRGFIDSVDMEDDYTRYSHQNTSNSLVA